MNPLLCYLWCHLDCKPDTDLLWVHALIFNLSAVFWNKMSETSKWASHTPLSQVGLPPNPRFSVLFPQMLSDVWHLHAIYQIFLSVFRWPSSKFPIPLQVHNTSQFHSEALFLPGDMSHVWNMSRTSSTTLCSLFYSPTLNSHLQISSFICLSNLKDALMKQMSETELRDRRGFLLLRKLICYVAFTHIFLSQFTCDPTSYFLRKWRVNAKWWISF